MIPTTVGEVRKRLNYLAGDTFTSTTTAAGTTGTVYDARLWQPDPAYWVGANIYFPNLRHSAYVTAYDPAAKSLSFSPAYTSAIGPGEAYELHRRYAVDQQLRAIDDALEALYPDFYIPRDASLVSATLSGSIDAAGTVINIGTDPVAAGFPAAGAIQIDDEFIAYYATTPTGFSQCVRGAFNSQAAPHSAGAQVILPARTVVRTFAYPLPGDCRRLASVWVQTTLNPELATAPYLRLHNYLVYDDPTTRARIVRFNGLLPVGRRLRFIYEAVHPNVSADADPVYFPPLVVARQAYVLLLERELAEVGQTDFPRVERVYMRAVEQLELARRRQRMHPLHGAVATPGAYSIPVYVPTVGRATVRVV